MKRYNKQGTVLRMETTLNNMRDFKAPCPQGGKARWRRMRKGVSDIGRRAEVSEAANRRYLATPAAVGDGKFLLNGFRNRDPQEMLGGAPAQDPLQQRRRSGQITRKLWLPRAHGIIRKVPGTHRYLVADHGRQVITCRQAARAADISKLASAA